MSASDRIYRQALEDDLIVVLRESVNQWRRNGGNGGDDLMYELEIWVQEIWGDEE